MPLGPHTLRTAEARARLAEDPGLGGGNAWRTALRTSHAPDAPAVVADPPLIDVDGRERAEFSLRRLDDLARAWSAWYAEQGVGPRDRVAVYIRDSLECQVHLTALAQIGAIAVLVNGRMDPVSALGLMRRTDPVGVFTDVEHLALLAGRHKDLPHPPWVRTREDVGALGGRRLADAACYRHADEDPVVICHSSGTTGDPKPVVWTHRQSVAGACFRLATHPEPDRSVMLSAVPHSHTSAVAFTFYALLAGLPLVAVSGQSGRELTRYAAQYRPTRVLAFNHTFADLASAGPDPEAFATVEEWMNVGDSAHYAHMLPLMRLGRHEDDGVTVPGSVFGDGLGSSELGWAALRRVTTLASEPTPRCLGRQVPISEVAVLRSDGSPADPGEPGMLGVRGPSIAPGYWNDSDTTYRSTLGGYWLSGDLVYRTAADDYFQIDRVVDVIRTPAGDGHSLLMEDVLLLALPEVADCAVVAGGGPDGPAPVAVVRPKDPGPRTASPGPDPQELLRRANTALAKAGQPALAALDLAASDADLPVGSTGKVLKRRLREKYADLSAYVANRPPRQTASLLPAPPAVRPTEPMRS